MNLFSILSLFAFGVYLYIGIYTFRLNKNSTLNRLFLYLCLSMSIWSFAYAFVYISEVNHGIWIKISAIGWCTFSAIVLHLALIFTGSRSADKPLILILIYTPGFIFLYMSAFLFWPDSEPSEFAQYFFYIGDFIYNFSYLLISIILIYIRGRKSDKLRQKKQANIIAFACIMPFLLNLITQTILPMFGIELVPNMGQIYSLIMIVGIYYASIEYGLFGISSKLLVEEILTEAMDLIIILSPEGKIVKINNRAEELLSYNKSELIGKPAGIVLNEKYVIDDMFDTSQLKEIHKYPELNCVRKNGELVPVCISCSPIIDPKIKDLLGIVIVGHDITLTKKLEKEIMEHKEAQRHITYLAYHDSLTGLPNRKYLYEKFNEELEKAKDANVRFAVLYLDLDGFKAINDNFGHEAGDYLLRAVGRRIKNCIRKSDMAARVGGDEFIVLALNIDSMNDSHLVAEKIFDALSYPIIKDGKELNVQASIGISIFPDDGDNADILINNADNKMYLIKKIKKNGTLMQ